MPAHAFDNETPGPVTYKDGSTDYYTHKIGEGAQGSVWASRDGKTAAKFYNGSSSISPERRAHIIDHLIELDPARQNPYWKPYFAWPQKRIVKPTVGYSMPLAHSVRPMADYVFPSAFNSLDPTEQGWFYGRLAAAMKIAHAVSRLAGAGVCYPDLSYNNVLLDCFDARVTLIDCDSIIVNGSIPPEVLGTPRFLAPELWSQRQAIPTVESDRHSLATVLYMLLVGVHPLIGQKVHFRNDAEQDDVAMFGPHALYIEHPTDRSNRNPNQSIFAHDLGPELQEVFQQAFVSGLHHPERRPHPQDWLTALAHTFDRVVPCPTSGQQCWWHSFVALPTANFVCPCCRERLKEPHKIPFLHLLPYRKGHGQDGYDHTIGPDKHHVVMWPGRALYQWHSTMGISPWSTDPHHPISRNPYATCMYGGNDRWYLKNIRLPGMLARRIKPTWTRVPIGSSVPLINGTLFQFGSSSEHYRAQVELHTLV